VVKTDREAVVGIVGLLPRFRTSVQPLARPLLLRHGYQHRGQVRVTVALLWLDFPETRVLYALGDWVGETEVV